MILSVFVRNTLKLIGKVVIAGGTVVITYQQGLWGQPNEHRKALQTITQSTQPYLPFELPSSHSMKTSWNSGVTTMFETLDSTPELAQEASASLVEKVKELVNGVK